MNPYKGTGFFEFIALFFQRCKLIFHAESWQEDEIQIYILFFLGVSTALIGSFLMLQKKMMLVNSISHTILIGIVGFIGGMKWLHGQEYVFDPSFSFQSLVIPAFISSILTYYLTNMLIEKFKIQEDASIGIVFTFLFGLSIFIISFMGRNSHLGLEAILGNLDAVNLQDCLLCMKVCGFVFVVIIFLFPYFTLISFDQAFAKLIGMRCKIMDLILIFFCGLVLIVGFKSVGVIMILALMTIPLMISRLFYSSIYQILIATIALHGIISIISVAVSRALLSYYKLSVSTSGVLVVLLGFIYFFCLIIKNYKIKKFIRPSIF